VSGAHPRGSWDSPGPRQAAAGRRSGRSGFNVSYAHWTRAIFLGPFLAGVVGQDGEALFLALVGAAALGLGARLLWRHGS